MRRIKPLAPRVCPQCDSENSFAVLENRIECRVCGYALRKDDGYPLTPADTVPKSTPKPQPSQPLRASYRTTHIGPIDKWAHAAFDTGQDYIRQEKWQDAIKSFQRAIDYQHDFVDAHLWISRLLDDPAAKRDHLENALAVQPNHLEAIRELMILDGKLSPGAAAMDDFTEPELRAAGGAVGTDTENIRCPRCGSLEMGTDDITGLSVCNSCGYAQERDPKQQVGDGLLTMALLEHRAQPVQWVVGERLLACNSCGAQRTIPAQKLSERCPFCGSNHVIERDILESFQQPDGLIPFRVSPQKAEEKVNERLGGWMERFKGILDNNRVERITIEGMFVPFWVFDSILEIRRTTFRTGSEGRSSRDVESYQTETFPDMMNNVPVCAVESPPRLLTRRLSDYDLQKMIPYEPQLLSKYPAELYSMPFDKASLEARSIIAEAMRAKYRAGTTSSAQVNIYSSVKQMSFQLVLKPVWVATLFEEDGDIRTALVNGQTGRVVLGKAHKSPEKRR